MTDQADSIFVGGGGEGYGAPQRLLLKYGNRHGLIAGATGTGKTVTLQILAEGFSAAGVPVFLSDVKGDLAGIALPGSPSFKNAAVLEGRARDLGMSDYAYADNPVVLALSMLLHAFSFALAHSCAMQFIQQFFPSSQRSRGQALYAGLVYGGGGAFGAYLCGWTWQDGAGSTLSFLLAASAALIAACLTASLPKHIQRFGQA